MSAVKQTLLVTFLSQYTPSHPPLSGHSSFTTFIHAFSHLVVQLCLSSFSHYPVTTFTGPVSHGTYSALPFRGYRSVRNTVRTAGSYMYQKRQTYGCLWKMAATERWSSDVTRGVPGSSCTCSRLGSSLQCSYTGRHSKWQPGTGSSPTAIVVSGECANLIYSRLLKIQAAITWSCYVSWNKHFKGGGRQWVTGMEI